MVDGGLTRGDGTMTLLSGTELRYDRLTVRVEPSSAALASAAAADAAAVIRAAGDPPVADFDDPLDVKVVALADACRRQQVGEGHFASIDDVPTHAITVTIPALLRAGAVLAIVPETRKAQPVADALTGPISTACPASVLRRAPQARLYLDRDSASLL